MTNAGAPLIGASGAAPVTGAPASSARPPTSSGYVDIRKYLDANEEQAQKLGGQVGGMLSDRAEEVGKTGESVLGDLRSEVEAANPFDPGLIDRAVADPTAVANDDEAFNAFRRAYTGDYRGPNQVQDVKSYQPFLTSAGQLQDTAALAETEGGRKELLSQLGGPQRSAGETNLDQFLLQAGGGIEDLKTGATSAAEAARQALERIGAQASDYISGFKGQIGDRASQIQDRIGGVVDSMRTNLGDLYGQANRQAQDEAFWNWYTAHQPYKADIPAAAELGLGLVGGGVPTGVAARPGYYASKGTPGQIPASAENWRDNVTIPNVAFDLEQYARPEDFAREAALEKLTGGELDILANDRAGEAGTWRDALDAVIASLPPVAVPEGYVATGPQKALPYPGWEPSYPTWR